MKHTLASLSSHYVKCYPLVAVTPICPPLYGHHEKKKSSVYGFPAYIDSYQGREFESRLLNELLQFSGKIDLQ